MINQRTKKKPNRRAGTINDGARYAVNQPAEIVFVLKQIMQNAQLVTAYPDGGADFALTSLLAVMPDTAESCSISPDAAATTSPCHECCW
jgi:hypothetical protein